MRNFVKTAVLATAACMLFAASAMADYYRGGWRTYSNSNSMVLGDASDGTGLYLTGTSRYCQVPGASYSRMRSILYNDDGGYVDWWVANSCDGGYRLRICIENDYGDRACSTYNAERWINF